MHTHAYFPRLRLGLAAALLLSLVFILLTLPNRPTASAAPGDYTVSGKNILDPNGNIYHIHGVARSGYETNPNGDGHFTQTDMNNIRNWNANTVRIALNQSYVLTDSPCDDPNYLGRIDAAIAAANNAGMNVILDLHWNDRGNAATCSNSQQFMADTRSLTFWNIIANRYKANKTVFLELYNEPHDISWSCWRNGCTTSQGWQAVGMQQMYDTVRNTGFTNLILIGGLNWAYDLSGVPSNRPTGYGIVYVTHPYDFAGKQPADWPSGFGFLTATDPVIATEFGQFNCGNNYVTSLINYMDAPAGDVSRRMGWTAWAWNEPGSCGFPSVLADWNGNPSTMGVPERNALLGYGNPPPTPTRTNTPTGPTNTPTRTNTPVPPGGTIRVESGGTANFTDTGGNVWATDNGFSGGSTVDRGAIAIANTNDDRIYQTERFGNPFSYAFNVANGTYTVNLHFAETFFTSSGQRVLSVTAEGATIVSNLDIFASAGANTAHLRTANVTVNDGQLNLNFTASVNNALVNGIEIIPSSVPTATPTRTNTPVSPTNTPTRTNTPTSGNTHGGTWAIRGILPAAANFKNVSQIPSVTSNSTYVGSIWIKGAGSVWLGVKHGSWGADIVSAQCNATGTWAQCSTASFNTGANTQLTFVLQNSYNTAGTVYIDDMFLGISGGTNRLTNPGLESGNVNWFISDGTIWSILQP